MIIIITSLIIDVTYNDIEVNIESDGDKKRWKEY